MQEFVIYTSGDSDFVTKTINEVLLDHPQVLYGLSKDDFDRLIEYDILNILAFYYDETDLYCKRDIIEAIKQVLLLYDMQDVMESTSIVSGKDYVPITCRLFALLSDDLLSEMVFLILYGYCNRVIRTFWDKNILAVRHIYLLNEAFFSTLATKLGIIWNSTSDDMSPDMHEKEGRNVTDPDIAEVETTLRWIKDINNQHLKRQVDDECLYDKGEFFEDDYDIDDELFLNSENREEQRTLVFSNSRGSYYYFSLSDLNDEILPEYYSGYFVLLAEIIRQDEFIVYSDIIHKHLDDFIHAVDSVLETLTEREQIVLRARFFYNVNTGKKRAYDDIAKAFNVGRERIHQIEAKALGKMRHPSRSKKLKPFWTAVNKQEKWSNYGALIEKQVIEDVALYLAEGKNNQEHFFSEKIIKSPRFFGDNALEERKKHKRIRNINLESIYSSANQYELYKEESISDDSVQEEYCKEGFRLKRYHLDVETMFSNDQEQLITRAAISADTMTNLLEKGFFYVSDVTDYYQVIMKYFDNSYAGESLIESEPRIAKEIMALSTPLLRVKISRELHEFMIKHNIATFNRLVECKEILKGNKRREAYFLIDKVLEYREKIDIG